MRPSYKKNLNVKLRNLDFSQSSWKATEYFKEKNITR